MPCMHFSFSSRATDLWFKASFANSFRETEALCPWLVFGEGEGGRIWKTVCDKARSASIHAWTYRHEHEAPAPSHFRQGTLSLTGQLALATSLRWGEKVLSEHAVKYVTRNYHEDCRLLSRSDGRISFIGWRCTADESGWKRSVSVPCRPGSLCCSSWLKPRPRLCVASSQAVSLRQVNMSHLWRDGIRAGGCRLRS